MVLVVNSQTHSLLCRSSPLASQYMRCMQQTLMRGWTEKSAMLSCRLEPVTETGRTFILTPYLESSLPLWNWIEKNWPSTAWVTCVCSVWRICPTEPLTQSYLTLSAYHCGPGHGPASALWDHTTSAGGVVGHWWQWACISQTTSEKEPINK